MPAGAPSGVKPAGAVTVMVRAPATLPGLAAVLVRATTTVTGCVWLTVAGRAWAKLTASAAGARTIREAVLVTRAELIRLPLLGSRPKARAVKLKRPAALGT